MPLRPALLATLLAIAVNLSSRVDFLTTHRAP